jgi:RNA recognition motif-containing protein
MNTLGGSMSTRLHVGNIPSVTAEHELRATFSQFGHVDTIEIATDPVTGKNKGFAIVSMLHEVDAQAAIQSLNFSQYSGRTIGVSKARASRG